MSEAEGSSIPGSAFGMAGWAASPGRKLSKTSPHCYRAAVDRDARVLQVATTRFVEDPACDHAGHHGLAQANRRRDQPTAKWNNPREAMASQGYPEGSS